MKLIFCLDDRDGYSFNGRRQSRDAVLTAYLGGLAAGSRLLVAPYSAKMLAEAQVACTVSENPAAEAGAGDYVFLETAPLPLDEADELIVCRWNRTYPSDRRVTLAGEWRTVRTEALRGRSHDRIDIHFMKRG